MSLSSACSSLLSIPSSFRYCYFDIRHSSIIAVYVLFVPVRFHLLVPLSTVIKGKVNVTRINYYYSYYSHLCGKKVDSEALSTFCSE